MTAEIDRKSTGRIIEKAISLGATLAGFVSAESVRNVPSYRACKDAHIPEDARSFIVLALEHGENDLYLDWWDGNQGTEGNRRLIEISKRLRKWLKRKYGIKSYDVPYQVEKGGIFLKDAAVHAGLGVIGKNNLLITRRFGPRIRLCSFGVNAVITSPEYPVDFSPCENCDAPCMSACPQNAFRSGKYDRRLCKTKLQNDEKKKAVLKNVGTMHYAGVRIKYCRICELACHVGKQG